MGIDGAGNSGTVLAVLFAPPLAVKYGGTTIYGLAALTMVIPILVCVLPHKSRRIAKNTRAFASTQLACSRKTAGLSA